MLCGEECWFGSLRVYFFFQAEDGIRDLVRSRGLGDVYKRQDRNAVELLGRLITPEIVRQVIQKASAVNWGAHFLRWRYFDVTHAGRAYHRGTLVATALWHLLKRIYVDQDWPADTTLDQLNADARATIQAGDTEIWCYGYYRIDPPRLQWGFFNSSMLSLIHI